MFFVFKTNYEPHPVLKTNVHPKSCFKKPGNASLSIAQNCRTPCSNYIAAKETYFYKKAKHIGHIFKSASCANKRQYPEINWVE